jgi:DNA-binding response OmpR family regulator
VHKHSKNIPAPSANNPNRETLKTILYVDDEEDLRNLVSMALETVGGLEVITCGSGEDALRLTAGQVPDLILLDVMMPGMDGPTTFRKLRQMKSLQNTPMAFITAKSQTNEMLELEALGSAGMIKKPFDPMTLFDTVSAIYSKHKSKSNHLGATPVEPNMQPLIERYRATIAESTKTFIALKQALKAKPQNVDRELINSAISLSHQIAGSAGTFGFIAVGEASLLLEDQLTKYLENSVPRQAVCQSIDLVLKASS